ncbi:F-box domain-containing protein [Artemisia annua]|uniref:F-box domain-containing protein n=1 Tax=Artemisia annua TaxID=35608 RepID=A0A2U1M1C9_ARTAN|nr:F-box domain-containing protein [Artemisia annua]
MAYQPQSKPKKNPPPVKKDNPKKDQGCNYCNVVGHWKRNCPLYLDELRANRIKKVGHVGASTSDSMERLPRDVLTNNIFIRLPAKLLAQMRCVSKPWNNLLSRPSFIKSHLNYSLRNNDEILLVFYDVFSFGRSYNPFTAHPSRCLNLELTNFIKLPVETPYVYDGCSVIGSVNGLICFVKQSYPIHIWNPSLSAVLTLPPFTVPAPVDKDGEAIMQLFGSFLNVVREWLPVEGDGLDGIVHWICCTGEERDRQTVVAFDLGVKTFNVMSLPDPILEYRNVLGFLAGKLCAMSRINGECEVWVMGEYGVAESWSKNHVFSLFSDIAPFGFTSNNEFLFEACGNRLVLYDSVAAKVKLSNIQARLIGITKIVQLNLSLLDVNFILLLMKQVLVTFFSVSLNIWICVERVGSGSVKAPRGMDPVREHRRRHHGLFSSIGNYPVPWSKTWLDGIYSTRSGTYVDDSITTSLFILLGQASTLPKTTKPSLQGE